MTPPRASRPKTSAAEFLPERAHWSLERLSDAAGGCRGCDLYASATQTVFGDGLATARIMMVGEQPGDAEDLAGKPFVGQAGRLLDDALEAAGVSRAEVYITNAVKHFKFTRRGKRRIHDKPTTYQVKACRPWLEAELAVVRPAVLVLLGATAAQALLGASFRVSERRGEVMATPFAPCTIATLHPAAVLRVPDDADRVAARDAFFADIAVAAARTWKFRLPAAKLRDIEMHRAHCILSAPQDLTSDDVLRRPYGKLVSEQRRVRCPRILKS